MTDTVLAVSVGFFAVSMAVLSASLLWSLTNRPVRVQLNLPDSMVAKGQTKRDLQRSYDRLLAPLKIYVSWCSGARAVKHPDGFLVQREVAAEVVNDCLALADWLEQSIALAKKAAEELQLSAEYNDVGINGLCLNILVLEGQFQSFLADRRVTSSREPCCENKENHQSGTLL